MSGTVQQPSSQDAPRVQCPKCGYSNVAARTTCRSCGASLEKPAALPVAAHPLPLPLEDTGNHLFKEDDVVLLAFVSIGQQLFFPVEASVLLGRDGAPADEPVIDLNRYEAKALGVSRQHCRLQRRENQLLVTDLDSSNFTYLNGQRLIPHRPYVLAHGDHLLLGQLYLVVYFRPPQLD